MRGPSVTIGRLIGACDGRAARPLHCDAGAAWARARVGVRAGVSTSRVVRSTCGPRIAQVALADAVVQVDDAMTPGSSLTVNWLNCG